MGHFTPQVWRRSFSFLCHGNFQSYQGRHIYTFHRLFNKDSHGFQRFFDIYPEVLIFHKCLWIQKEQIESCSWQRPDLVSCRRSKSRISLCTRGSTLQLRIKFPWIFNIAYCQSRVILNMRKKSLWRQYLALALLNAKSNVSFWWLVVKLRRFWTDQGVTT